MLTIYHWEPVASSGKPLIAACEKGVAFASHYVDVMAFEQHAPAFLRINPEGTLPAMVHDGVAVRESGAMMEYLDEAFDGPALRPPDPHARWRMRWWCRYLDAFLWPAVSTLGWHAFVAPALQERRPSEVRARIARVPGEDRRSVWSMVARDGFRAEALTDAARRVARAARELDGALATREWLAGNDYSLADIAGFCMLAGLPPEVPAEPAERVPHLMAWLRRIDSRAAVRRALELQRTGLMHRHAYFDASTGDR